MTNVVIRPTEATLSAAAPLLEQQQKMEQGDYADVTPKTYTPRYDRNGQRIRWATRARERYGLLHISKFDQFRLWCLANNIGVRPGKGVQEALQVQLEGYGWLPLSIRTGKSKSEHFSAPPKLESIIRRFIEEVDSEPKSTAQD